MRRSKKWKKNLPLRESQKQENHNSSWYWNSSPLWCKTGYFEWDKLIVFFPIKHHILWEATKFEKNLPLSGSETFHKLYNSARRKEENCNSLAGIETSHLCYAMIQVILNEIDSLFFQIKVHLLWESQKMKEKNLPPGESRKIAILAGIGTSHLCYTMIQVTKWDPLIVFSN